VIQLASWQFQLELVATSFNLTKTGLQANSAAVYFVAQSMLEMTDKKLVFASVVLI
jgi:hypothetical protein